MAPLNLCQQIRLNMCCQFLFSRIEYLYTWIQCLKLIQGPILQICKLSYKMIWLLIQSLTAAMWTTTVSCVRHYVRLEGAILLLSVRLIMEKPQSQSRSYESQLEAPKLGDHGFESGSNRIYFNSYKFVCRIQEIQRLERSNKLLFFFKTLVVFIALPRMCNIYSL